MILMIELNICLRYGKTFWSTACLSVNAGLTGDTIKNTDYAAIAKAITPLADKIEAPSINRADLGFLPDGDNILYGLAPISGIGQGEVENIIANRPYTSITDFHDRAEISDKKTVQLIKAGCFDEIEPDRRKLMIQFVDLITPRKKSLTTVQIPKIKDKIPGEFTPFVKAYQYRNLIQGRNKVLMTKQLEDVYFKSVLPKQQTMLGKDQDYYSYKSDKLVINKKPFDKWFNAFIKPLKAWLKTKDAVDAEAKSLMRQFWIDNCSGNVESWEMDSLSFYTKTHELELTPVKKLYKIQNFSELPEEPDIAEMKKWRGRDYPIYRTSVICGTVVDHNRKGYMYVVTPDKQTVGVRVGKNAFAYYNKKVMAGEGKERHCIDEPWTARGTKLLVVGYRRGGDFVPYNKNSGYENKVMRVNGYGSNIQIQTRRAE